MSSQSRHGRQKTPQGGRQSEEAVKLPGTVGVQSLDSAQGGKPSRAGGSSGLMEEIVSRDNMLKAWRQVKRNNEAPGVDGITVDKLWPWQSGIRAEYRYIRRTEDMAAYYEVCLSEAETVRSIYKWYT